LAAHPEVKAEFPGILIPDIIDELRRISVGDVRDPRQVIGEWAFNVSNLHHLPVLQKLDPPAIGDCHAYSYFKVHILNDALARESIEPDEERAFLDAIRERFWEDARAELSSPTSTRVLVEHRHPELRFHRSWGWWTDGTIGMASTLSDLNHPGHYSAAELVLDLTRFFRLASLMGACGPGLIRVGYDPGFLQVRFEPSDKRAELDPALRLGGIQQVDRPALKERSREQERAQGLDLSDLATEAHKVVADLLVPILKDFHLARISTQAFADSIPALISGTRDLLVL
jgi:hypothetical protein